MCCVRSCYIVGSQPVCGDTRQFGEKTADVRQQELFYCMKPASVRWREAVWREDCRCRQRQLFYRRKPAPVQRREAVWREDS